ncbi:hypothetical protein O6H91_01G067600 [Diphasiastrum complanatum]|uniref:Uncharacterized protein n=1 Tax=Diphasiastrum complanatum TaxID=34168 RepID=A0ACC2ERZ0_DIPCM|nr:hypothetical protein O6H91_01G067600 [Diphasiastrum complanatum]
MEERVEKRVYPASASEYKLLEEIGEGSSAKVYRALCLMFNEVVAVKSLDLDKCNSNLDEIRREAQLMSLMNHPNVVKAHCSFVNDCNLWVVMPYMGGGSCLHIMKAAFSDGFEEPIIATLLKETLKALEYIHREGHIHRDVKAGNILVDVNGAVKLGDFGVSACMFESGDRQRSRNTFVGTPCWMAPEVMEHLHGYNFKADIWSFGITALELAHGHAPFSKYPPMKVLLMTLQNAPPGLNYERDKRFSKSFKEMIAMCLVKDPSKRPTAEKLLKHSFFRGARSSDYLVRHILENLSPLWERVKALKDTDAARLAEKQMPFGEQEERSQNEYKRGVSSWNFDVVDLKVQAALIQDDDETHGEKEEAMSKQVQGRGENQLDASRPQPAVNNGADVLQQSDCKVETNADVHSADILMPSKLSDSAKHMSTPAPVGKKEPLHIGRFDVFEDDILDSPGSNDSIKPRDDDHEPIANNGDHQEKDETFLDESSEGDSHFMDRQQVDDHQEWEEQSGSDTGPSIESVAASYKDHEDERDRDKDHQQAFQTNDDLLRGSRDGSEEKLKGGVFQKKGRFHVTSEDVELMEDGPPISTTRRSGSAQAIAQISSSQPIFMANGATTVSVAAIMPHLQGLLQVATIQQDTIMNLINNVNPGEASIAQRLNHLGSRCSSRSSIGISDFLADIQSDRERELMQQVAELQCRNTALSDELQSLKLRNVQLERQLNAIYNKEEEERIRREEAADK